MVLRFLQMHAYVGSDVTTSAFLTISEDSKVWKTKFATYPHRGRTWPAREPLRTLWQIEHCTRLTLFVKSTKDRGYIEHTSTTNAHLCRNIRIRELERQEHRPIDVSTSKVHSSTGVDQTFHASSQASIQPSTLVRRQLCQAKDKVCIETMVNSIWCRKKQIHLHQQQKQCITLSTDLQEDLGWMKPMKINEALLETRSLLFLLFI